ncbi:hypothetical protein F511_09735 [Dorcoceras hygrometricum]|uniref:Uncharacterized protein n=1 Tax=Dorcoceras hygrometricum TaxID=472368 RepID=A0A2Z7D5J9_9LAMI|nr:hypothetical protein F511_09735 [Dorcoceras hygrometricum]
MGFSNFHRFVTILILLLPIITITEADILDPYFDNICNEVQCGKGSCQSDRSYPFGFKCVCDSGWKRTRLDDSDEQDLLYLPCIIPNCSLDYSCMPAAPPAPPVPHNTSIFDPCYWIYCGEGTCTKNTTRTHICQCNTGYSNLLNISAFPCYSDCAIRADDCQRLGIRVSRSNSGSSSNSDDSGATTLPMGILSWMAMLIVPVAFIYLK